MSDFGKLTVMLSIILFSSSEICAARTQSQEIVVGVFSSYGAMANVAFDWSPPDSPLRLVQIPRMRSTLSYDKGKEVYDFLEENGVHIVIGYHDYDVARAAEKLGVFYLTTTLSIHGNNVTCNMLPTPGELTEPLLDVMRSYQWRTIGVIYEETLDSAVINTLVEYSKANLKFHKLTIFASMDKIREMILDIRELDISHFLLLTSASVSRKVFTQARRLGIISKPFTWIVLNLGSDDVVSGILDDLRTNVTLINFVTPNSVVKGNTNGLDQLGVALMRDSFHAVEVASKGLVSDGGIQDIRYDLAVQLYNISFDGETGFVKFNRLGRRMNYTVNILVYNGDTFIRVGNWRSHPSLLNERLTLRNMFPKQNITPVFPLQGKVAQVVTIMEPPFCTLREDHEQYVGNKRYEGFVVDMMDEISEMLEFEYVLHEVHDGNFGVRLPSGEWNGMIGEVLSGNATMAVAPLSINTDREKSVDFTKPFKTRSIMVLMKTPESTAGYFQFMNPLSNLVWLCILGSVVTITFGLFMIEKHSTNVSKIYPRLNAKESAWFIFGAIVGGGSETSPVTIPGRILTSAWWFFALILTSTYTANLAAFLTVKKINAPITSATDLLDQNKIIYGTVRNSGVMTFLQNTRIEPFNRMWTQMSEIFPDAMVNTTLEGVERVKKGNYAFLWDNTVTSYWALTDCEVTEIGPPFDPKGFGIALPPGASYLEELSLAILKLSDRGKIIELESKWWKSKRCEDHTKPSTDETTELTLDNVAGLFFVLICGVVIALIACIIDWTIQRYRKRKKEKRNYHVVELKNNIAQKHNTKKCDL